MSLHVLAKRGKPKSINLFHPLFGHFLAKNKHLGPELTSGRTHPPGGPFMCYPTGGKPKSIHFLAIVSSICFLHPFFGNLFGQEQASQSIAGEECNALASCCLYRGSRQSWRLEPMNLAMPPDGSDGGSDGGAGSERPLGALVNEGAIDGTRFGGFQRQSNATNGIGGRGGAATWRLRAS